MKIFLCFVFLVGALQATAQSTDSRSAKPEASITHSLSDESTFRQIFRKTVDEAATLEDSRSKSAWVVEAGGQMFVPRNFTVTNSYFEVPYSSTFTNIAGVGLEMSWGVFSHSSFLLSGVVGGGYRYGQALGKARSLKTQQWMTDSFRLQDVSSFVALRAAYSYSFATLFVEPGIGMHRVNQNGYLDGLSEGFWVPATNLRAGLVLFDQTQTQRNAWFGGVGASVALENSFSSKQKIQGRIFNLHLRARL